METGRGEIWGGERKRGGNDPASRILIPKAWVKVGVGSVARILAAQCQGVGVCLCGLVEVTAICWMCVLLLRTYVMYVPTSWSWYEESLVYGNYTHVCTVCASPSPPQSMTCQYEQHEHGHHKTVKPANTHTHTFLTSQPASQPVSPAARARAARYVTRIHASPPSQRCEPKPEKIESKTTAKLRRGEA